MDANGISGHVLMQVQVLDYAVKNGCSFRAVPSLEESGRNWPCLFASLRGHVHILKYADENGFLPRDDPGICLNAAEGGHLEVLKYAHSNGHPWDALVCAYAARSGHLEVLKYALDNGCSWDERILQYAIDFQHPHVVAYVKEKGLLFDFGGSRVEGVRRFNVNLGGKDSFYSSIEWNNAPFWFNWLKKMQGIWKKR